MVLARRLSVLACFFFKATPPIWMVLRGREVGSDTHSRGDGGDDACKSEKKLIPKDGAEFILIGFQRERECPPPLKTGRGERKWAIVVGTPSPRPRNPVVWTGASISINKIPWPFWA